MRTLKLNGIIIFKKDFGESDRLFHIFTEHEGKIEVIGKNLRNGSRRSGHLELFNYGSFFLYKSKNHYYLNQCEAINEFQNLKNDLDLIGAAYFATEMLDKLTPLEDSHQDLFILTLDFLKTLESTHKRDLILLTYKVKLMTSLGLLPEILECTKCGTRLAPELTYIPEEHNYYCINCIRENGIKISPNTTKLFYHLRKSTLKEALNLKANKNLEQAIQELTTLTDSYLQDHLGKPLKTMSNFQ